MAYNTKGGIMKDRREKVAKVVESILRCQRYMHELVESDYKSSQFGEIDCLLLDMISSSQEVIKRLTSGVSTEKAVLKIETGVEIDDESSPTSVGVDMGMGSSNLESIAENEDKENPDKKGEKSIHINQKNNIDCIEYDDLETKQTHTNTNKVSSQNIQ